MAYINGSKINTDSEHIRNLGYTGSTNAEFDQWYSSLSDLERDYVNTANPALFSAIQAYNSAPDDYHRQQIMNAYLDYQGQSFEPTLLQQIGEAFGDHSARASFQNSINKSLVDAVTRVGESAHTEAYTDPAAELARRKNAGINDALSGGSQIGSGEPGSIDERQLSDPFINDGQSDVSSIAQIGTSIVSFAMQMYTGFQNIRSITLDNAMKELSVSDQMRDIAWNVIGEGVSEFLGSNKGKYTREELLDPSFVQLAPSLVQSFGSRINSLPLTRRQKRSLRGVIDSLPWSYNGDVKVPTSKYQTLINNMNSDLFKSRNALAQASALPGADAESIDVIRAIGDDIYRPLVNMSIEIEKATNRVKLLQARFDSDYYSRANQLGLGSQTAETEFSTRKLYQALNDAKNDLSNSFNAIRDKVFYDKKLSDNWKMALMTGISITEVISLNQLMTASSSGLKLK